MTDRPGTTNIGAIAVGGGVVNTRQAVGQQMLDRVWPSAGAPADVGILTVLTEELRAVIAVLRRCRAYRSETQPDGSQVHRAEVDGEDGVLKVVAMQTLEPGPHSAAAAFHRMRHLHRPPVVLLVGIAGGIRSDVSIGDVVIGSEVVYYDARRETAAGPRRRGRSQPMAPVLRHRVNDFFLRHGNSIVLPTGAIRVFYGPVGSGDAVIMDDRAEILDYLRRYNEKTLAVETEAAGVGQASYEAIDGDEKLTGWLTIRGISDLANPDKGHDRHQLAADHAALVVERLLPLLRTSGTVG